MAVKLMIAASTGRLDLSELRLAAPPPGLWDITGLEDLSLAGNDIPEIPEDLGALACLRRLVVAGNRLRALPAAVATLPALEGLWAHGNALQALPAGLERLTNLKILSLAGGRPREGRSALGPGSKESLGQPQQGNPLNRRPPRLLLHAARRTCRQGTATLPTAPPTQATGWRRCQSPWARSHPCRTSRCQATR
jgi:hypothetical protein